MLNGIMFSLKHMSKNNHTLASYPYTEGFKFLTNDEKFPAINEADRVIDYFFVKFLSRLDTINQLFFSDIRRLLQQMIANRVEDVVIPAKYIRRRKKLVKDFIQSIESKMILTIALPIEIQTAIDEREARRQQPQLQQLQQPTAGGRGNDRRDDQDDRRSRNTKAWWT